MIGSFIKSRYWLLLVLVYLVLLGGGVSAVHLMVTPSLIMEEVLPSEPSDDTQIFDLLRSILDATPIVN